MTPARCLPAALVTLIGLLPAVPAHAADDPARDDLARLIAGHLKSTKGLAVDLGCGDAGLAIALAKQRRPRQGLRHPRRRRQGALERRRAGSGRGPGLPPGPAIRDLRFGGGGLLWSEAVGRHPRRQATLGGHRSFPREKRHVRQGHGRASDGDGTFIDEPKQVQVPGWVRDLKSFRRWAESDEFPEDGRVCYLKGEVWVDIVGRLGAGRGPR